METKITITTSNPESATVLIEILTEMYRAIEKHPTWPSSPVERAAIICEEAGEVIREANHIREGISNDTAALRTELIQTATTCIRMINIMDSEKILEDQQAVNLLERQNRHDPVQFEKIVRGNSHNSFNLPGLKGL